MPVSRSIVHNHKHVQQLKKIVYGSSIMENLDHILVLVRILFRVDFEINVVGAVRRWFL